MIKLDLSRAFCKEQMANYENKIQTIHQMIQNKTGLGNDFLGWLDYANGLDSSFLEKIQSLANKVREECEVLVVIGIGGSYLGARAAIDAINGLFKKDRLEIIYLGNTLSPYYVSQVVEYLKDKKIAVNVVSKSGTTIEPAIAFRFLKPLVEKVWKERAHEFIFATTDQQKGALKPLADSKGYTTFIIPDDVGGRYSVITPVGLFPMACAGLDIKAFIEGVKAAMVTYRQPHNIAYQYALTRYLHFKNKQSVEFFINYEPHLNMFNEWLKQLFGESEGKQNQGLLPASLCFTTDLHSMGQFCQEGHDIFFETTLRLRNYQGDITIPEMENDADHLNYLVNKKISYVNDIAIDSTLKAHCLGHRSNIVIELEKLDEYHLGELFYFFMVSCACSAYLLEVNPFNQPGVEVYKKEMKELLKK